MDCGSGDRCLSHGDTDLIESFDNSGKIVGVTRESTQLRADYILQSDLREFQAELDSRGGAPFAHAAPLSSALGLDMKVWFTPTAENFFAAISKPQILAALHALEAHLAVSGRGDAVEPGGQGGTAITITGRSPLLDVKAAFRVESQVTTTMSQGPLANGINFLQLRGTYTVTGWMRGNSTVATCSVKVSPGGSTNWVDAMDLNPPQTFTGSTWTRFAGLIRVVPPGFPAAPAFYR